MAIFGGHVRKLRESLFDGTKKIGVWGTGYIGFSTMSYFAAEGVSCIGTDVVQDIVDMINRGEIPIPTMEYWLGFDIGPLVKDSMIYATTDWRELLTDDIAVHFIAVPTEKGDEPWDEPLIDVMSKIATIKRGGVNDAPLIIIESTLTPNRTDRIIVPILEDAGIVVGEDVFVGVAPRRDWFISPDKNLKSLPRIYGGTSPETNEMMRDVLSIVCNNLVEAPDHRHAEIVKSVENAYRHMEITLANQLSLAYPHLDMTKVLKLAGTKWNLETYHPSFGCGGYCIPLASKYVLGGAVNPESLTLLKETIKTDSHLPIMVADYVIKRGAENVGILGLSYKGNLKVYILSPTLKIVERLKAKGVNVKVNDPYYSAEEIKKIVGTRAFKFPEGLNEFDTILIVTGHRKYRAIPREVIIENLKSCKLVIDNMDEAWKGIDFSKYGIEYCIAGGKGWLI